MLSVSTVLGEQFCDVEQSWEASAKFLTVAHHHVGQEEDKQKKASSLVSLARF